MGRRHGTYAAVQVCGPFFAPSQKARCLVRCTMGNSAQPDTLSHDFGAEQMTRLVALRASAFFTLLALAFGALGLASHAAVAEALFMIAGSLCALMLVFAYAAPDHVAVPIRANRQRR